jgi:small subunit ribosomal protein S2
MQTVPAIEEMLKAGMHFGHRTSKWHPKMAPYIFGSRNGVHIIDLLKTQKLLGQALDFLKKFSSEGKIILLVGTKMQARGPIKKAAEATGMPYVATKWLGGTMTNYAIIKKMVKKYVDLINERETGGFKKYTKKEQLERDREIIRLKEKVGGLVAMPRLPDAIFILDIKVEENAVAEAKKKNVPIIAICDTNTNPTGINYVIPSNDDATKTIALVMKLVEAALVEGKNEAQAQRAKTLQAN